MKKVLALLMVAGMFSLVACGPSEEEKKENVSETIEIEKNPESVENIKKFVDQEKELIVEDF